MVPCSARIYTISIPLTSHHSSGRHQPLRGRRRHPNPTRHREVKSKITLQNYLNKLKKWLKLCIFYQYRKIQGNPVKKTLLQKQTSTLKLFRSNINWHDDVDYLGVSLDKRLTFKNHLRKITCKFKRRLQALHKLPLQKVNALPQ
ncbi:hypothetical protein TNCV_5074041 [Trichonephila clavipes]|nr:hypothetical protein TNCV_5074041 [Trichonephila clavipes]